MAAESKIKNHNLTVTTSAKSLVDITDNINAVISKSAVDSGLCNIFVQHTSCSLIISENYDSDVLLDLETFMSSLVSEKTNYRHSMEGKDDMPAHIRSVLTQTSLNIPIVNKQLALGQWQAVYLWEHRALAHKRKLIITVLE